MSQMPNLCSLQVTVVQTLKQCVQKQLFVHCAAATPRSTPPRRNSYWMSPLSAWKAVTSFQPWGRLCRHPRGLWFPRPKPWHLSFSPCWLIRSMMPWRPCRRFSLMWSRASRRRTTVCQIPDDSWWAVFLYLFIGIFYMAFHWGELYKS